MTEQFEQNISDEWGEAGRAWLAALPDIVQSCLTEWGLEIEPSEFELSYNYVAPVRTTTGAKAVLKIGFPRADFFHEAKFLTILNGRCSPKVIHISRKNYAIVIERLQPGSTLAQVHYKDDELATSIALPLLRELPVPIGSDYAFPSVYDWCEVFDRIEDKLAMPVSLLRRVRSVLAELQRENDEPLLLHGDLHHHNILCDDQRGWLAIDPQGVKGPLAFNAARFIINPRPGLMEMPNPNLVIKRRLEIIANGLGIDKRKLAAWAFVDCVLSAAWFVECGCAMKQFELDCAEILKAQL